MRPNLNASIVAVAASLALSAAPLNGSGNEQGGYATGATRPAPAVRPSQMPAAPLPPQSIDTRWVPRRGAPTHAGTPGLETRREAPAHSATPHSVLVNRPGPTPAVPSHIPGRAPTPVRSGAPVTGRIASAPPERPIAERVATPVSSSSARPIRAVAPTGAGALSVPHCLVSLIEDAEVSAQEAGLLVSVPARDGDAVQPGDLLAQIDDRQAQIDRDGATVELRAAQARAEDDIEVRYSEAAYEVAKQEFDNAESVNRRVPGTIPRFEVRRLQLTMDRAKLQIDRSRLDLRVAKMSAEVNQAKVSTAEENIRRRQVRSPIVGHVLTVHMHVGEWVDPGAPVLRVARMDRLRVEGFLDASRTDPSIVAGKPVVVQVELAEGRRAQFSGIVTFVNPLMQAGNKFRVRAEVENRLVNGHWLLQPGKTAAMTIRL